MAKASKPLTKSQIVTSLAETAGITKKQAAQTLEALVAFPAWASWCSGQPQGSHEPQSRDRSKHQASI